MSRNERKIIYSDTVELKENEQNQSHEKLQQENKIISQTLQRIEEENHMLRELFNNANNELANLKKPALLVADTVSIVKKGAIIRLPNGNKFFCNISRDVKKLVPGDTVLVEQKALNIVSKIEITQSYDVEKYVIIEKPNESFKEVGGLKREIQEVKEVIELPLTKPHLFKEIGITPPKGLLLYGPPGTGKTLLAKAVAHSTNATFIEVVGSELVQKFIGEGAKLVKDIFALARRKAPAIIFIDEIDALAATRMDTGTSGEREVNRTFMQLLAEVDGFKALDNVKIIGATNRLDILDPAIIRPGRLDRLVEVDLPDEASRLEILKVHTRSMSLEKVSLRKIARGMDNFSGAEIRAACTEAGFFAIRDNRGIVTADDFEKAVEKVRILEEEDGEYHLFG